MQTVFVSWPTSYIIYDSVRSVTKVRVAQTLIALNTNMQKGNMS